MSSKPHQPERLRNPPLVLNSFLVSGYRCFGDLIIQSLAGVNLFIGKNNVGKTSILEAIYLFGKNGRQQALIDIVYNRGEIKKKPDRNNETEPFRSWALEHIFKDRRAPLGMSSVKQKGTRLLVGDIKNRDRQVSIGFYQKDNQEPHTSILSGHNIKNLNTRFSRIIGDAREDIVDLWKKVELTAREDFIIEKLRILSDELVSIRLLDDPDSPNEKLVYARLRSQSKPVLLTSLGFGINRLFEILLLGLNCQNGILLIDEIESGIHYSALEEIWSALFEISEKQNVQIFLTGSGRNSGASFNNVAIKRRTDFAIFQLERNNGEITVSSIRKEDTIQRAA